MSTYNKWVAMWGNAMSITENKPESYAKNITLRYEIYCPFDGDSIRITFDNYCGTEDVQIEKTVVISDNKAYQVLFGKETQALMAAGQSIVSDELSLNVKAGQTLLVSFYLKDFTQMRSSVFVRGMYSNGCYAIGDMTEKSEFDINLSKKINNCYFLSNISIRTKECNRAIVCYGDSITAQDWPDILKQKLKDAGIDNVAVIRRATSGSRILRQYSCITYESYGLMGRNRFEHEVPTDGADTVIIQQGINDIIHPVGAEINPFRPMSDLPTAEELCAGLDWYIQKAKDYKYKIFLGTLLPIEGWRTYADFREELRTKYNDFIRNNTSVAGIVDFDKALRNRENEKSFAQGCDSGDHLHPSIHGYELMAEQVLKEILDGNM